MRFSKSSEYAIRCLVYLARRPGQLCSVRELAESLDIPQKFLGRQMARLKKAGLVDAVRGKSGGYSVRGAPADMRLEDIVEAVEGLDVYERCILGFDRCDEEHPCSLHAAWVGPRAGIRAMTSEVTLADLLEPPSGELPPRGGGSRGAPAPDDHASS